MMTVGDGKHTRSNIMSKSSKAARDNRANQLNPAHSAFHQARGNSPASAQLMVEQSKPVLDNRANQLNPNNAVHAASKGELKASSETSTASLGNPE
jgi:hypothetical protein